MPASNQFGCGQSNAIQAPVCARSQQLVPVSQVYDSATSATGSYPPLTRLNNC